MQVLSKALPDTSVDVTRYPDTDVSIDARMRECSPHDTITTGGSETQCDVHAKDAAQLHITDCGGFVHESEEGSPSSHRPKQTDCSEFVTVPAMSQAIAPRRECQERVLRSIPARVEFLKSHTTTQQILKLAEGLTKERRQLTLAMFLDEIALRRQKAARRPAWRKPSDPSFVGYVSVVVTDMRLVELYQAQQMFYGVCSSCKTGVFANTSCLERHQDCPALESNDCETQDFVSTDQRRCQNKPDTVDLEFNFQILGGISDETGGLLHRGGKTDTHDLLLTEQTIFGLTGLHKGDFLPPETEGPRLNKSHATLQTLADSVRILDRLRQTESQVLWARVTLVLAWISRGGANGTASDRDESDGNGVTVVLDVFG